MDPISSYYATAAIVNFQQPVTIDDKTFLGNYWFPRNLSEIRQFIPATIFSITKELTELTTNTAYTTFIRSGSSRWNPDAVLSEFLFEKLSIEKLNELTLNRSVVVRIVEEDHYPIDSLYSTAASIILLTKKDNSQFIAKNDASIYTIAEGTIHDIIFSLNDDRFNYFYKYDKNSRTIESKYELLRHIDKTLNISGISINDIQKVTVYDIHRCAVLDSYNERGYIKIDEVSHYSQYNGSSHMTKPNTLFAISETLYYFKPFKDFYENEWKFELEERFNFEKEFKQKYGNDKKPSSLKGPWYFYDYTHFKIPYFSNISALELTLISFYSYCNSMKFLEKPNVLKPEVKRSLFNDHEMFITIFFKEQVEELFSLLFDENRLNINIKEHINTLYRKYYDRCGLYYIRSEGKIYYNYFITYLIDHFVKPDSKQGIDVCKKYGLTDKNMVNIITEVF